MDKLTQVFKNKTDQPIYLALEMSSATYRLVPGEELLLRYEPKQDKFMEHGAPITVEFHSHGGRVGLVIYTREDELFCPDGKPAKMSSD